MTELTERFDEAVAYARIAHGSQMRKGTEIPYMSHLMAAAGIVLELGGDEDTAIAALLHDSGEDAGGLRRVADLRARFGDGIADIVIACSDPLDDHGKQELPWRERKERYLQHLESASPDAVLVSFGDKLHNARCMLLDYRRTGDALWERFNAGKADQRWYYDSLTVVFRARMKDTVAVDEFARIGGEMFG